MEISSNRRYVTVTDADGARVYLVNETMAKRLRSLGFDCPTRGKYVQEVKTLPPKLYYGECADYDNVSDTLFELLVSAPSLGEAARWLDQEKGIEIEAVPRADQTAFLTVRYVRRRCTLRYPRPFPSVTEALYSGIVEALEVLTEEQ